VKKLAVFLYSMGPGGAERNVANLLPFLVKRYEVHLILMSKVIAYEIPSEVQIHFIENSDPYESGLKKLARLFLAMPMLAFKYKNLCQNLSIDTQFVLMNRPCYIAAIARILGLKASSSDLELVGSFAFLTPGDFAAVLRANKFSPLADANEFANRLNDEIRYKKIENERRVGF